MASAPGAFASHSTRENVSAGGAIFRDAYYAGASEDGLHVYFKTIDPLVPEDGDTYEDIYERYGNTVRLVSTGVQAANGNYVAVLAGSTPNGEHAFLETAEPLDPADDNFAVDVYDRVGANTIRISTGPDDANVFNDASFKFATADGGSVLFETAAGLVASDVDEATDVYMRANGGTTLVTTGQEEAYFGVESRFAGASRDASRVFFTTSEPMVAADTDGAVDVYARHGTTTELVSTGPSSSPSSDHVEYAGATPDGDRVLFVTAEQLVATDTDSAPDLYERAGSATTLVSTGPQETAGTEVRLGRVLDDGSAFFTTDAGLVASDTDGREDVYRRAGGVTTLVSVGGAAGARAFFVGASDDGAHVFFNSAQPFVAADTDDCFAFPEGDPRGCIDVYERSGGVTSLVSGSVGTPQDVDAFYTGNSADGTRVFFQTFEPLIAADTDDESDVYERFGGTTSLISGEGPGRATFSGMARDGSRVFFWTPDSLTGGDLDGFAYDVYAAGVVPGPPVPYSRPKGATPLLVALVPAYEVCEAINSMHGPPLAFESCNPPLRRSFNLTFGTPDANGAPANSTGSVQYRVVVGAPGPPEDSDVTISARLTDVRCEPDTSTSGCGTANAVAGADYAGNLRLSGAVRITDKLNGGTGGGSESGTVRDLTMPVTIPCASTSSTAIGGSCAVTTSANAVSPGLVKDGKRAVWGMGQALVQDARNSELLAVQGLFVP